MHNKSNLNNLYAIMQLNLLIKKIENGELNCVLVQENEINNQVVLLSGYKEPYSISFGFNVK